ncbi:hypothetical protein KUTeg_010675 [Tegillarca granosa]|uniref:FLYWCH-type domain-containing protein n=1 Tax=Tegillarca granosa TaxID=220873 RepID=A0ABQ9F811_TEGGR|nr:hypothetical protein KUTeg_010675 [Tegillarca granosa]
MEAKCRFEQCSPAHVRNSKSAMFSVSKPNVVLNRHFHVFHHSSFDIVMANVLLRPLEFVKNKHGGDSLIFNGYQYQVKNRRNDRVYWKCHVTNCTATFNTYQNHIVKFGNVHNHPSEESQIDCMKMLEAIKKRCRYEVRPIPSIYEESVSRLRNQDWNDETRDIVEQLPTFYSCKSSLYRQRATTRPPIPKTRDDVHIQGDWCLTCTEKVLHPNTLLHPNYMLISAHEFVSELQQGFVHN